MASLIQPGERSNSGSPDPLATGDKLLAEAVSQQAAMLCKPYLFKQVLDQSMHFCTAQAS
jgi:hypothetical protein